MKAPDRADVKVFASAAEFRRWLETNHATEREAWIGYYRKGVPKRSISYPEAVEEALCFGWIDGIGYRIDDEVTANRFTPRTKRSTWSAVNVRKVGELRAVGRMHPAGMAAFEARTADNTGIYSYENRPPDLPETYLRRLKADVAAWRYWQAQTPGYRRGATWWVVSAKQEATRERRLATLIEDSAASRMIKPLAYGRDQRRN
ncbi:MAG: YdeI/OmpD-associated family protein [Chloroflexota bacterium]|nr:YdeI/OmpD-associated family protein [Chloroflexota bacterium]